MSDTQRKRYSAQERDHFVELWKNSGLSQLAFSQLHQIPAPLFYSWIRKDKMNKVKMLPVEATATQFVFSRSSSIQILLPSGVTCQFSGVSHLETLIQFIKEYEQCNSRSINHRSG